MTTEIELLPLPEWMSRYTIPSDGFECDKVVMLDDRMHDYARENVAHHTAALKAEIEALREVLKEVDNELDWLDGDMDTCDHSVGVCMCSYWSMRRKMKAALARENSND